MRTKNIYKQTPEEKIKIEAERKAAIRKIIKSEIVNVTSKYNTADVIFVLSLIINTITQAALELVAPLKDGKRKDLKAAVDKIVHQYDAEDNINAISLIMYNITV